MADTAEEVRKEAAKYYEELTTGVHDMLLAYADLLEAQPELLRRLRAAEADAERWKHQLRVDYERHSGCSATSFEQFSDTRNAAIDTARGEKP